MAARKSAPKEIPAGGERRPIHAYLSEEAHAAWHEFAAAEGVSVSGLLEVIPGAILNAKSGVGIVKAARKVDSVRRRRGKA